MSDEKKPQTVAPTPDAFASIGKFKAKTLESGSTDTKDVKRAIDQVAESNGFHSREAMPAKKDRFNSTGPKKQLNLRVDLDVYDEYYAECEKRGIRVLGELLRPALAALKAADKAEADKKD